MALHTPKEALALVRQAGFPESACQMALAVMFAESASRQPDTFFLADDQAKNVTGNTPPSEDRGLFQINSYWHPEVTDTQAFDALENCRQALRISAGGTDWKPWSTFGNGRYKFFMGMYHIALLDGLLMQHGEFQGRNGDCSEYSVGYTRMSEDASYIFNAAELNANTTLAIDDGEAASSGAMTPAEIAWLCSKLGLKYVQVLTGDLVAAAQNALELGHACILTFTNGQALVNNEQGVHGHAVAGLSWDGEYLTVANGDSSTGEAGEFDNNTLAQWQAASPYSVTVLEITPGAASQPGGSTAVTIVKQPDGSAKDESNGNVFYSGFADALNAAQLEKDTISVPEVTLKSGEHVGVVRGDGGLMALTYSEAEGVKTYTDPDLVKAINDLYAESHDAQPAPSEPPVTKTFYVNGVAVSFDANGQAQVSIPVSAGVSGGGLSASISGTVSIPVEEK